VVEVDEKKMRDRLLSFSTQALSGTDVHTPDAGQGARQQARNERGEVKALLFPSGSEESLLIEEYILAELESRLLYERLKLNAVTPQEYDAKADLVIERWARVEKLAGKLIRKYPSPVSSLDLWERFRCLLGLQTAWAAPPKTATMQARFAEHLKLAEQKKKDAEAAKAKAYRQSLVPTKNYADLSPAGKAKAWEANFNRGEAEKAWAEQQSANIRYRAVQAGEGVVKVAKGAVGTIRGFDIEPNSISVLSGITTMARGAYQINVAFHALDYQDKYGTDMYGQIENEQYRAFFLNPGEAQRTQQALDANLETIATIEKVTSLADLIAGTAGVMNLDNDLERIALAVNEVDGALDWIDDQKITEATEEYVPAWILDAIGLPPQAQAKEAAPAKEAKKLPTKAEAEKALEDAKAKEAEAKAGARAAEAKAKEAKLAADVKLAATDKAANELGDARAAVENKLKIAKAAVAARMKAEAEAKEAGADAGTAEQAKAAAAAAKKALAEATKAKEAAQAKRSAAQQAWTAQGGPSWGPQAIQDYHHKIMKERRISAKKSWTEFVEPKVKAMNALSFKINQANKELQAAEALEAKKAAELAKAEAALSAALKAPSSSKLVEQKAQAEAAEQVALKELEQAQEQARLKEAAYNAASLECDKANGAAEVAEKSAKQQASEYQKTQQELQQAKQQATYLGVK
jgi:hypothetical protein